MPAGAITSVTWAISVSVSGLFSFCLAAWFSQLFLAVSLAHRLLILICILIPRSLSSCLWQLFSTLEDSKRTQTRRKVLPTAAAAAAAANCWQDPSNDVPKIWITCGTFFFPNCQLTVSIGIPIGLQQNKGWQADSRRGRAAHSISSPIISVNKSRDGFLEIQVLRSQACYSITANNFQLKAHLKKQEERKEKQIKWK